MPRFINVRLILNKANGVEHCYQAELEHENKASPPPVKFDFNLANKIGEDKDFRFYFDRINELSAKSEQLRTVGIALYKLIFQGELKGVFETWIAEKTPDELLHLRLDIRTPELVSIPWELFFRENTAEYLARRGVSIVRYINNATKNKVKLVSDLKVLITSAAPNGNLHFNENEYIEPLKSLFNQFNIVYDCMSGVSYSQLRKKLNDNKYDLFYFIGHGIYEDSSGKIILRNSDGKQEKVESGDLGTLLSKGDVQLAFFHSCQTAQINRVGAANQIVNPFLGVAQNLIAAGVPAVVAMQYNFPQTENGKTFVCEFYNHLLMHKNIDQAMQQARDAIKSSDYTWCIPVLYLQNDISNVEDVPIANETNAAREISQPQKIAELLLSLNYRDQERNFQDVINRQAEGAFLIQAEEEIIQHWLIRRLAGCVPDFTKAKIFLIKTDSYAIRSNSVEFWSAFQKECVDNRSCESVIHALAELCQRKSVIIAMYGLRVIEESKITQIHNFWLSLVKEVRSRDCHFRSKLILLIAQGNSTTVDQLHPFEFSISLAPLEKILQSDAKTWLEQEKVYDPLNRLGVNTQAIVRNDINTWDEEPSQMLEEICQTLFKISDGIAAIEPYWKLAG
ncbi:MAG: CHAT domain-containing protein [Rhizonema sp. PD38]|nr:CHAT domain-containing protein [Rhizonema sp. PD38]